MVRKGGARSQCTCILVTDPVPELLDNDGVVLHRIFDPGIEAWRGVAASALAVGGGGILDREGSRAKQGAVAAASIGDYGGDGVR